MLNWKELVELPEEQLNQIGLLEIHLACAEGLPGAEDLDLGECQRFVDACAALVATKTEKFLRRYRDNPAGFSEAQFRMAALITVMQRDLGIVGDPQLTGSDELFLDSRNIFIHGLLTRKGGSCSNVTFLYVMVGRQLGYPLKLVPTRHHIFARWEDGRERFNVECTNLGFFTPPDDYYLTWPVPIDKTDCEALGWLRSMPARAELAGNLIQRGGCLERNRRYRDAVEAFLFASAIYPDDPLNLRAGARLLLDWLADLLLSQPPLFPFVRVIPPERRRFPDSVPLSVEKQFHYCDILEQIQECPNEPERGWWAALRSACGERPANVPTEITVQLGPI